MCKFLAALAAAKSYQSQIDNHRISGSYYVSSVVQEQGYLAQAKTLIANPPSFCIKQQYCQEMEKIHNKAGRTVIEIDGEIQDVRTMGNQKMMKTMSPQQLIVKNLTIAKSQHWLRFQIHLKLFVRRFPKNLEGKG